MGGAAGAIVVLILVVAVIVIFTAVCARRKTGADLQKEFLDGYHEYGRYVQETFIHKICNNFSLSREYLT